MAVPVLSNSVPLNEKSIDSYVNRTSAGVYVLGPPSDKGGVYVRYIGRSDGDLNGRLKQHVGKYSHFVFAYCNSALAAYHGECELFHHFNPANNTNHPAQPANTNHKCPVCR